MIVADTNVVSFLLLPGERRSEARRVQVRDPEWIAPPLWGSEFRNVLVTHVRVGRIDVAAARDAWRTADRLVRAVEIRSLDALELAIAEGLSAYDAEFVALARALGVPLVTDDRRILESAPDVAVSLDAFADAS